jgi:hypothetical protein
MRKTDWSLNEMYIISYKRPECITARMLQNMGWPKEHWHIMCEDDDPTLNEYRKNWGKHVLTFRIQDYLYSTDYLDNAGTTLPHGAAPVRNAVIKYSHDHGDKRHWQLDDDYMSITRTVFRHGLPYNKRCKTFDEAILIMSQIAEIGYDGRIPVVGGTVSNKSFPDKWDTVEFKVFNIFNIDSNGLDPTWRGRMNDDTINCIDVHNSMRPIELVFNCLSVNPQPTQSHAGGLTDIYKQEGTIRKTAYALMLSPMAVVPDKEFGRVHNRMRSSLIQPKLINPDDVKQ